MLSVENFTLGPSAEQDFDVNFTAASLLQGVYSTRICAYNQTETGAFLHILIPEMPLQSSCHQSCFLNYIMAQPQNIPAQLGPSTEWLPVSVPV